MIMEIHSSYGVLECEPMTLQAIEKSIPEDMAVDIRPIRCNRAHKGRAHQGSEIPKQHGTHPRREGVDNV